MATPKFPAKDPADIIDEKFDWTAFLEAGETITTAVITVAPSGELNTVNVSNDANSVTFHATDGVAGNTYTITCQITTSAGNTVNRKATLAVKDL